MSKQIFFTLFFRHFLIIFKVKLYHEERAELSGLIDIYWYCCCFINGKTRKHVHHWKQDSSTFGVKLVNLSIPPKKNISIILKDSHSYFRVFFFDVTCTCSHVQYANSALVPRKLIQLVTRLISCPHFKLIDLFSLCRVRYRLIIICSSVNTRLWVQTFLRSNKSTWLVHCFLYLSTKLTTGY